MNSIYLVVYPIEEYLGFGIKTNLWYLIGIVLAVLLLGYLIYSIFKPEDF